MCKYKLPCGLCELTKTACSKNDIVSTDSTIRSEDQQVVFDDLQSIMTIRNLPIRFNKPKADEI